jgi:hypothetical protein
MLGAVRMQAAFEENKLPHRKGRKGVREGLIEKDPDLPRRRQLNPGQGEMR